MIRAGEASGSLVQVMQRLAESEQASSELRGFLISSVRLLDRVECGQYLGRLCNPLGETLAEFHAPCAGIVGLLREFPVVEPEDPLFLITEQAAS